MKTRFVLSELHEDDLLDSISEEPDVYFMDILKE